MRIPLMRGDVRHRFRTTKLLFLACCVVGVVDLFGCRDQENALAAIANMRKNANKKAPAKRAKVPLKGSNQASSGRRLLPAAKTSTLAARVRSVLGDLSRTPIGRNLSGFSFGRPLHYKRVTLLPIKVARAMPKAQTPMTIDESFRKKRVEVTEEGSGNVPKISLRKRRTPYLFVMTGDMFLGAKQDRISKHDLLLTKRSARYQIPVYCVEQGRWNYGNSSSFRAGNSAGSWRLRRSASKKMSQSEIWRNVGVKTSNVGARTSTQTMAATYRSRLYKRKSPGYLKRIKSFAKNNADAIGYIGMIKGRVANMELFANNALFRKMWPKMSKAMILDAIDPKYKASKISVNVLVPFLRQLLKARYKKTRAPGVGREYLITHRFLSGTLLLHRKELIHLSVFPDDNKGMKSKTGGRLRRLQRLYQRRNNSRYLLNRHKSRSGKYRGWKGLRVGSSIKPSRRRWSKKRYRKRYNTRPRPRHIRIYGKKRLPLKRYGKRYNTRPRRRRSYGKKRLRRKWRKFKK